jgi:hypothetical protein
MPVEYDFDIQHYSIYDIERLFQLSGREGGGGRAGLRSVGYTVDDVYFKRNEFYDKVLNSSQATDKKKLIRSLQTFLDEACDLLVYFIRDKNQEGSVKSVKTPETLYAEKLDRSRDNRRDLPGSKVQWEQGRDMNGEIILDYQHNTRSITSNHGFQVSGVYDRTKNEIVEKKSSDFTMVMHNEFNPGKMNPIHTPVITKCLNIDTRFRDNLYTTQSSDFIFTLPDKIRKVVSMQLSAYEFPVTFYSTSASYGNNYFNIFCTYFNTPSMDTSMTIMRTIIVPDGNYSAMDLIANINNQLCPKNPVDQSLLNTGLDASGIWNCIQMSIDVNSNGSGSGKVTISTMDQVGYTWAKKITSIAMNFTLSRQGFPDLVNITSKIGWNLGFIQPMYYGKTSYVSDALPDPASIRYLYLVVNDFNNSVNNNFVGAFNKWILNNNVLARIPINGQYFNILMENQLSQHLEPRKYFGPVDVQRLHIQLLDDHGRILDINNANFSLCLTFKTLYD